MSAEDPGAAGGAGSASDWWESLTDDEKNGVAWWNTIHEAERLRWLKSACSAVPAEAWAYFKAERAAFEASV